MKFTTDQNTLRKSISGIIGVVAHKSNDPIIQNIKIEASGGRVSLSTTNGDTFINNSFEADIELDGSTTAPAHTFFDIVKKIPNLSKITIHQDSQSSLKIGSGRSRYKLSCLPSSDFPTLSEGVMDHNLDIKSSDLITIIDRTKFAISSDETRYYLTGLCFNSRPVDGSLVLNSVATDGHRLAVSQSNCLNLKSEFSVIVPKKSALEIRKIINECELVNISLSNSKIKIIADSITFVSKLIDGSFPDYNKVIPTQNDQKAVIDKSILFECVDRISTVTTDKYRVIKLIFNKNKLTLDASSGSEELDIEYNGNDIEIGFNSRYLLDVISQVEGEFIELNLKDNNSPALIKNKKSTFVLMPTRL